jgi:large subunit ribosomal protein L20
MVRARSKATTARRKKRLRKLTKGFRLGRHNLFRMAKITLLRARVYAFRDRKAKKREYRRLWIVRINAACRMRGIRYSEFMYGLQLANVMLNRKSLAELAIHDPSAFDKLVELAKKHLPKPEPKKAKPEGKKPEGKPEAKKK